MKISHLLVLIIFVASFLISASISTAAVARAEGNSALQESKFVEVASVHIHSDEYLDGLIKNGSEVSITVILTNFSQEIDKSTLNFQSDLEKADGTILVNGQKKFKFFHPLPHKGVNEAKIIFGGKAPDVEKRENITLLSITQRIKAEYSVIDIKRDVTSEIVEEAILEQDKARKEINKANSTIANAEKIGAGVPDAKTNLYLAKEHLNNSYEFYDEGNAEKAIEEATNASHYGKLAKDKAEAGRNSIYGIIAVIIVVAIILGVFLYRRRSGRRGRLR